MQYRVTYEARGLGSSGDFINLTDNVEISTEGVKTTKEAHKRAWKAFREKYEDRYEFGVPLKTIVVRQHQEAVA